MRKKKKEKKERRANMKTYCHANALRTIVHELINQLLMLGG